jgi:LacI family transcriptional regulator
VAEDTGLGKVQRSRAASLMDVARRANVSMTTASRIASGSSYPVSIDRRERVEKAIIELDYTPNALARALARHQSLSIGVLVGSITDPYFAEVTRGIEDQARRSGHLTILCNTDRNIPVEKDYVEMLRHQHAAGIVLVGGSFTGHRQHPELAAAVSRAVAEGSKVIAIGDSGLADVPSVGVDDEVMLFDLTEYVCSLGHRRVAFVAAPAGFTSGDHRLAGFQGSMQGRHLDPSLIYVGGFDYTWGRRAAARMLRDGLPDAVIAFNDESALGVLRGLRDDGVRVPEDISIAGVDDTRDARFTGLTSVTVPMYELGTTAARRITQPDLRVDGRTVLAHRIAPRLTTAERQA